MANFEVVKKAYYVGVWLEDVFTELVVQNIAKYAKEIKGKKVKVTLSNLGLRFKKTGWFNDKVLQNYPLASIKTVTRNPLFAYCVMFILADSTKKYRILALKCTSEAEAIHLVTMYSQIRRDGESANMELKKRDNGNWTLRERSAHNANRHLAEIFNEKKQEQPSSKPANGDLVINIPILDKSKVNSVETTTKPNYIKRNAQSIIVTTNHRNNNNNIEPETTGVIVKDANGDDYVIETEVSPYPSNESYSQTPAVYVSQPSPTDTEVTAFRGELDTLSNDVRDIKAMLVNMKTKDSTDSKPQVLPSKPVVYRYPTTKPTPAPQPLYLNGSQPVYSEPTVYRAPAKNYEATLVSSRKYNPGHDPWAAHRRLSGNFILPAQLDRQLRSGTDSGRSSLRVKFDTESIKSGGSTWSTSKPRKKDYSVPSTLERSIEETYGRQPVIVRRHGSAHSLGRPRPRTVHVVGRNELVLYDRHMDVAL